MKVRNGYLWCCSVGRCVNRPKTVQCTGYISKGRGQCRPEPLKMGSDGTDGPNWTLNLMGVHPGTPTKWTVNCWISTLIFQNGPYLIANDLENWQNESSADQAQFFSRGRSPNKPHTVCDIRFILKSEGWNGSKIDNLEWSGPVIP